jgi:hypothetical protein
MIIIAAIELSPAEAIAFLVVLFITIGIGLHLLFNRHP